MATTKVTNRETLNYILDNCDLPTQYVEKVKGMLNALDRKAKADRKPTPTQIANEGLKVAIVDFLSANAENGYTVGEMIKSVDELNGLSPQKVSALTRQLKAEGKVETYTEKRRSYFKIA